MTRPRGSTEPMSGPVAYLTGEYPAVSHTFIQREIAALRTLGVKVIPCTVRRPPSRSVVGAAQKAEARVTFCVFEHARAPHRLTGSHLRCLARAPRRWVHAAALAWRMRPPGLRAALWQLFYLAEAGVLADHLHRSGAVHLHNHFGDSSGTVTLLASVMGNIPFSYTMHGPTLFFEPKWWRLDLKTGKAAFVVCISHFARAQGMLFSDPADWKKLRIVHCGVFPEIYGTKLRLKYGQRLLFVGRLTAVKGVRVLLEAMVRLRKKYPKLHLTLVGDGPDRPALQVRVKELGLEAAVTFTGSLAEEAVAQQMEAADIFVLPSFAEGVPVVLMEAMASRMPVVATRVGGVEELVISGESGLVVPPGDADGLTMGIDRLLADPDLCARMGTAGRSRVEAEFDVRREAGWLMQLFADTARPGQLRPDPEA